MLKSSPDRYGAIPITIHWLTAILILLALGSGFQAGNATEPAVKVGFLRIHIPAAIIALLLTALRIIWWWVFDKKPLPVQGAPGWQERLARGVHLAFYVVILGMFASDVGMLVLSGAGPIIFGETGAALPDFHLYPPRVSHGFGANLLLALLFVHVAAALYHQFARCDGLLRRMWYRR
ncbi:cytochrome b [Aurantimonas endophytica]|uniref:Cytochrome b561 n=1 Tax=Aurantimonas endophytica TaxID=1522175 RepID=A0A7W6HI01_9HYPH|nr:cytochrome b/b6 domain-containing protein [Aurantimonas endophytica]MBB4005528.1 cytochrome b561 [Aurantimonas endophytica]MCO6406498.1 cytochrome b [Aurantimonas endophytica]